MTADDEAREALDMTMEELQARLDAGIPADIVRRPPVKHPWVDSNWFWVTFVVVILGLAALLVLWAAVTTGRVTPLWTS